MLMELLFWRKHAGRPQCFFLLTTACRYFSDISHYEFGKMFVTRITLSHTFKKKKNEQMMSKCFSAEFPRALDFEPWRRELVQRCLNNLQMFLENITFCNLFTNRLRPFRDFNHHSNQQQPPLPLLIGDMRSSTKQSLAVGVSCL